MSAAAGPQTTTDLTAPSLRRRLACFLYEGVLLFGVVMVTGLVYAGLTQQRSESVGRSGLMAVLFIVLGLYFVWFWSHGGQTVAMKTWHIQLVDSRGQPVGAWRALARYLLAWLWFLPALAVASASGIHGGAIIGVLLAGIAVYAAISRMHPSRQFLHDVLCGTRLVTRRPTR
ncbi:MAG TPA: RDD family protein [Albitalea sp.]|nr:RDD family protein [Albitalea sp.]